MRGFALSVAILFLGLTDGRASISNVLDRVEFDEAPLTEVVEYLQGHGVNFLIDPGVPGDLPVTLHLSQITVGSTFLCLVDHLGVDYRRDSHAWMIVPIGTGELAKREPNDPALVQRFLPVIEARSYVLDRVEVADLAIDDLVQYLNQRQKKERPDAPCLNLVISSLIDQEIPLTLSFTDTSVAELLAVIAEQSGIEVRPESYAIFLDPPGTRLLAEDRANKEAEARYRRAHASRFKGKPALSTLTPSGNTYVNKDPRSPAHPDYVHSSASDVRTRSNALNNVYKWVGGKWTFVTYGGKDPNRPGLDENGSRLVTPSLNGATGLRR